MRAERSLLPWAVLALVLALTVWAWRGADEAARRDARARFDARAAQIHAAVHHQLVMYRQVLEGAAGLFAASTSVTRREWQAYVEHLNLGSHFPGIEGMGYAQAIPKAALERHTRQVVAEGLADYRVWPLLERDEYTSIVYFEAVSGDAGREIGYDMLTDPTRRAAMERARDSGLMRLSGAVPGPGGAPGATLYMYVPVHGPAGQPLTGRVPRHAALLGWVFAPIRLDGLMAGVLGHHPDPAMDIELFDGGSVSEAALLYHAEPRPRPFPEHARAAFASSSTPLEFGGRALTLVVHTLPAFEAGIDREKSRLILIMGTVLALLLFWLTRALQGTRGQALALARDMTAALRRSEERYRQMFETNRAVKLIIDPADGRIVDANPGAAAFYGYSRDDLRAMRIFDLNPMPPAALSAELANAAREQRLHFNFQHRLSCGELRDVEVFTGPVREGDRTLLYSVIHDVTARTRALAQQRAILDTSVVGIVLLRERCFVWVNRHFEQMFGLTDAELRGRSTAFLYESQDEFERIGREAYPILEVGAEYRSECRMRRADGSLFWCSLSGKRLDGDEPGSIWILQDVSEIREAQSALAARTRELLAANRGLDLMARMTDLLQACDSLDAAYPIIAGHLPRLLPDSQGGLFSGAPDAEAWPAVARWGGLDQDAMARNACGALQSGKIELSAPGTAAPCCPHEVAHATLCLPVRGRDGYQGVLLIVLPDGATEFTRDQQVRQAYAIAERLTLSLSSLMLRAQLRELAHHDALTGLYNRRHLDESLEREVSLAQRKGRQLAAIMLDIDHFKAVNDRHGHEAGDEVLRALGDALARQVRDTDIACRYGGEEFLLLLPETGLDTALERAEALRRGMADMMLGHGGQPLGRITLSLGVAVYPEHAGCGDALVAAADAALYRAKRQGRDRVLAYRGDEAHEPADCAR